MNPLIIFSYKKGNKVVRQRSRHSKRIYAKIRACKKAELYKIGVVYGKDLENESEWYTNKKDLNHSLRAFTESGLLKDIKNY